jgi:pyruvate,water dikinase
VAQWVKQRPTLAESVRHLSGHEIAERLHAPVDADWRAFAQRFGQFIEAFGFRGQGEIDFAHADWEEAPVFALSAIKTYLDMPEEKNPYTLEEHAAQQREAIQAQITPAIPEAERADYDRWLGNAQRFTRLRESSKAAWLRHVRLIRPPLLELARRFVQRGLIAERDDLFWLTAADVDAAVHGSLTSETARTAVARRKAQAAELEDLELPEVFSVPVMPARRALSASAAALQGMPVSAGYATGPARVVLSAEAAMETDLQPGEVLVAPFTDAPWTPLFVPAAAVVVETGGILSHAATVAREFGIPAVVAVKGATKLIKTGQMVTVDGMTGAVTVG